MTDNIYREKFSELVTAIHEKEKAQKQVAALEKRIQELIGASGEAGSRKPSNKTLSAKDFTRACGVV